jgi:hypothetical protein
MRPARQRLTPAATALVAVFCGLVVTGCATQNESASREYLDERTAATVTVAGGGLVFARARPEYAVNARDYLTLVPVDVNRAGTHVLYFYGYVWSTIDKPAGSEALAQFELIADGRRIPLAPSTAAPRALGFGDPPVKLPARDARTLIVVTSREVLQFLVRAQELSALGTRDGLGERYDLWDDGRSAIEEFLHGGAAGR